MGTRRSLHVEAQCLFGLVHVKAKGSELLLVTV